jgi:radical SAM protein with 4Fe4S-binding SPASM domain
MPYFPSSILVETTIKCPADCVICPNKKIENRPQDMSLVLFKKIVDDCVGQKLQEFCPFINGEPLSWKHLDDGLNYVSLTLPDVDIVLYTNGYLLDSQTTNIVLKNNVKEIHFSVDGFSKQVYELHRRGLKYERVRSNITGFLQEKKRSGNNIKTHVAFTMTEQNKHEVEPFRNFWEKLVDNVEIIPCDGRGGNERSPAFEKGRQLPCFQTPDHTYILTDGSVVPCCKDWAGYSIMGNTKEQSIRSIWNSEDYSRFRKSIHLGRTPDFEVCKRCLTDQL